MTIYSLHHDLRENRSFVASVDELKENNWQAYEHLDTGKKVEADSWAEALAKLGYLPRHQRFGG